jgi:hypothetical protein
MNVTGSPLQVGARGFDIYPLVGTDDLENKKPPIAGGLLFR